MKIHSPFAISSRLAPAIKISDAWLSFDSGKFVFDFSDGSEHVVTGFRAPACRIAGSTNESELQDAFAAILSFLSACAESRNYAERNGKDPMAGDNSNLFPPAVGEWAQNNSDLIDMAHFEISETPGLIEA